MRKYKQLEQYISDTPKVGNLSLNIEYIYIQLLVDLIVHIFQGRLGGPTASCRCQVYSICDTAYPPVQSQVRGKDAFWVNGNHKTVLTLEQKTCNTPPFQKNMDMGQQVWCSIFFWGWTSIENSLEQYFDVTTRFWTIPTMVKRPRTSHCCLLGSRKMGGSGSHGGYPQIIHYPSWPGDPPTLRNPLLIEPLTFIGLSKFRKIDQHGQVGTQSQHVTGRSMGPTTIPDFWWWFIQGSIS